MGEQQGGESETRKAWSEVGERFSEVGRRIGERYQKAGTEMAPSAAEQRRALNEAVKKTIDQLDQAFTSVGDALRDAETRESLKRAARSLGDAVGTTFSNLEDEIRRRVHGGEAGPEPPPGGAPQP